MTAFRWLLIAPLAFVVAPARAQLPVDPVARDCSPPGVREANYPSYGATWAPSHPVMLLEGVKGELAAGHYAKAIAKLSATFDDLSARANMPATSVDSVHAQYALAAAELAQQERAQLESKAAPTPDRTRFNVTTVTSAGSTSAAVFKGSARMDLTPRDSATRRAICWPALAADVVMSASGRASRKAIATYLDTLDVWWGKYRGSRYSQFPWEMLIDGNIHGSGLEPPSWQLLLAHPSPAIELGPIGHFSSADTKRSDVLLVEWLGLIGSGDHWNHFFGASLASTFNGTPGMSWGTVAHVGTLVQLGVVARRRTPDNRRPFSALVSADVYRLLWPSTDKPGK